ncbi:hypothetical protein [Accumulibacter sp.]|uniref:hypothetical protein n=1 Tax=Accumulibacter sp. TaxID=2053492 RepID=UPI0028C37AFC|nr:hypothetical protein [Accumulibacter sp.]
MNVASALVSGNDPLPRLAEEALSRALGKTDAGSRFPSGWGDPARARFGGNFAGSVGCSDPLAWQAARLAAQCNVRLPGAHVDGGVSCGWQRLGAPSPVTSSRPYELLRLGDQSAFDGLIKALPAGRREQTRLPLASPCTVLVDE